MADVVFLLGAGASKAAGAPLMTEFLDVAETLWKLDRVRDSDDHFERVFKASSLLQRVHSKATLDIQNVESVFAAFDMAQTIRRFAEYTPEQIEELLPSMRRVIARTVELTLQYPVHTEGGLRPPDPYEGFVSLVDHLRQKSPLRRKVALLTFNYDLALDYALGWKGRPFSYGFDGKGSSDDLIPLLKLHGSINWFRCQECDQIIPWTMHEFLSRMSVRPQGKSCELQMTPFAEHFLHCEKPVVPEPVLVPPTWNKTEHHRELSDVWSLAARELSEAESIVLIGYSLPASDAFFRYLYALGSVGDVPLKHFLVVNPDQSEEIQGRFRVLLGPGAQQRFHYYECTFEDVLDTLKERLAVRIG